MEALESLRDRLLARFPAAAVSIVPNPAPSAQHSLLVGAVHGREIARFLRDDPALRLDYCSNVTGIDWPEKEIVEAVRTTVPDPAGGPPRVVEQKTTHVQPGFLEVVYHLYSMQLQHGPVILRLRTGNRTDQVTLPSFTPVWRSCEFQEREVYDLFGVIFEGHPDLRRILMWDEFKAHPMRRDYVEPDDYEWEPTPHEEVLAKARRHYPAAPADAAVTDAGTATPEAKSS
jgi:NADH-quinone oxidoreductase subunit C